MKYYLNPNENLLFLRNKKDIHWEQMIAYLVDVNFDYTTNKGNRKNNTKRLIYFASSSKDRLFLLSNAKFEERIIDFFKEQYIKFFNDKYSFRALSDVEVRHISLVEKSVLEFDNKGFLVNFKSDLNKKDVYLYPNNLLIYEISYSYKKRNKIQSKIVYMLDCIEKDVYKKSFEKSNSLIKATAYLKLRALEDSVKYANKKAFLVKEKDKISNVKILDVLKKSSLVFA